MIDFAVKNRNLEVGGDLLVDLDAYSGSPDFLGWMSCGIDNSSPRCASEVLSGFGRVSGRFIVICSMLWIDEDESLSDRTKMLLDKLIRLRWVRRYSTREWDALAESMSLDPLDDEFRWKIVSQNFSAMYVDFSHEDLRDGLNAVLELKGSEFVLVGHVFFHWVGSGILIYPHEEWGVGVIAGEAGRALAEGVLKSFSIHKIGLDRVGA
jgi:hypothetical protein